MPLHRGQIVLVDTNVIIEAHQTACLSQLANHFQLCTVEKVIEETQRGKQRRSPERNIDEAQLRGWMLEIGNVTEEQRFNFTLTHQAIGLDAGERDLLIWAENRQDAWILNSPDMAVLRFANRKGWLDRLVSLEDMCRSMSARLSQDLRENFRENWLSVNRTDFRMGVLR